MSGNYVYCGGSSLLQIRYVWKLRKSNLTKAAQDIGRLSNIASIDEDASFVYDGGGMNDNHVHKLRKSDLFEVAISPVYSANGADFIYGIGLDDNYVYCGGSGTKKVWKLQKSDLSKVAESALLPAAIRGVVVDGNFVYCITTVTDNKIYKLNKSDLSTALSATYTDPLYALAQDAEFVYCAGIAPVRKYRKTDLVLDASSPSLGVLTCVTVDDSFAYAAGSSSGATRKVLKFNKTTLAFVAGGQDYTDSVRCISEAGDFVYMGGDKGILWKIQKSNLLKVAESGYYDDTIVALIAERPTRTISGNVNSSKMVSKGLI